jgi:hypothetical protein
MRNANSLVSYVDPVILNLHTDLFEIFSLFLPSSTGRQLYILFDIVVASLKFCFLFLEFLDVNPGSSSIVNVRLYYIGYKNEMAHFPLLMDSTSTPSPRPIVADMTPPLLMSTTLSSFISFGPALFFDLVFN